MYLIESSIFGSRTHAWPSPRQRGLTENIGSDGGEDEAGFDIAIVDAQCLHEYFRYTRFDVVGRSHDRFLSHPSCGPAILSIGKLESPLA